MGRCCKVKANENPFKVNSSSGKKPRRPTSNSLKAMCDNVEFSNVGFVKVGGHFQRFLEDANVDGNCPLRYIEMLTNTKLELKSNHGMSCCTVVGNKMENITDCINVLCQADKLDVRQRWQLDGVLRQEIVIEVNRSSMDFISFDPYSTELDSARRHICEATSANDKRICERLALFLFNENLAQNCLHLEYATKTRISVRSLSDNNRNKSDGKNSFSVTVEARENILVKRCLAILGVLDFYSKNNQENNLNDFFEKACEKQSLSHSKTSHIVLLHKQTTAHFFDGTIVKNGLNVQAIHADTAKDDCDYRVLTVTDQDESKIRRCIEHLIIVDAQVWNAKNGQPSMVLDDLKYLSDLLMIRESRSNSQSPTTDSKPAPSLILFSATPSLHQPKEETKTNANGRYFTSLKEL